MHSATTDDVVRVWPDAAGGVQRATVASRASTVRHSARVGSRPFAVRSVHFGLWKVMV